MNTIKLQKNIYTLDMLRDEARALVDKGAVTRQEPIYTLCRYIPGREWECFKIELEENEFLQRDHIVDLLSQESWEEDA
ncbi:DUF4327 family protein [Leptolyngbya sp. BC1307]|uniref:DUF4327 family protein n=1 Tax=Leptolyngbya sp. BC1307 TaxID=2029589 RepID=UPI000EFA44EB|nr:DUF4327 family protein [Leptolyngbya sp. BC1307]